MDYYFSRKRDAKSAKRLLNRAISLHGVPSMITIDKSGSNYKAIADYNKNTEGKTIKIRDIKYKNNRIEQDHRFIKKRTNPMLGFKSFASAFATLKGFEMIRIIQKNQFLSGFGMTNFHQFQSLVLT